MEAGQCSLCLNAFAQFECYCAIPIVLLCESCLDTHVGTDGSHAPSRLPRQEMGKVPQGDVVCEKCHERQAQRFCLCRRPLRLLCEECGNDHNREEPLRVHFQHPLTAYESIASGRVPIQTFKANQEYISDFLLQLEQELAHFDLFVRRVEGEFDALIAQVAAQRGTVLRDFSVQRVKLASEVAEAQQIIEAKRYAESFEVEAYMDSIVLEGYRSPQPYESHLFAVKESLQGLNSLLENAVKCEVFPLPLLSPPLSVPVIKGNTLRLFDRITLQMSQITLNQTTDIDNSTGFCWISNAVVLCAGGWDDGAHNKAYEINVKSAQVEKTADMNWSRGWVGMWKYKEYCFVFGGSDGYSNLDTSEKYSLSAKMWTPLPHPMERGKTRCSVCEHSSGLYISGSGNSIEHFTPRTEEFKLLRVDDTEYAGILCCAGDMLYHISGDKIEAATIAQDTDISFAVKGSTTRVESGDYWLSCPMKWLKGELISSLHAGGFYTGLFRFSPETLEFSKMASFSY